jgi:hypothetical protein
MAKYGAAAVRVPRVPDEAYFRPAPLPGMTKRAERARQVLHEALERGRAPLATARS